MAIVSGHILVIWTHTSENACYFVVALRCVRAADQNMAAYNPSLGSLIKNLAEFLMQNI